MKAKYIRDLSAGLILHHNDKPNSEQAIRWAYKHWDNLERYGLTGKKPTAKMKQPVTNGYANLTKEQKETFDKFWNNYAFKHDRIRAVMKFVQLWDIIKKEKELFLKAAKKEAALRLDRTTTPPMAELWLNNQRWKDGETSEYEQQNSQQTKQTQQRNEAQAELKHFKSLAKAHPEMSFYQDEVHRLERQQQGNQQGETS